MKKIAIIGSLIAVAAVSATSWQIHVYNQQILQTLEAENTSLRVAMAHTELLVSGHEQTIGALESQMKSLTNHSTGATKAGDI